MGKAKAVAKVAAIGAAIAGVIFFWRKRQHHDEPETAGFPPASDGPASDLAASDRGADEPSDTSS